MPMKAPVKIVKDPENPQPIEIMEKAIVEVAEGARKLLGSRLTRRAILVLLRDSCNENIGTIDRVLSAAANLDKTYLIKTGVLLLAVVGLGACASAPRDARCAEQPQWQSTDPKGNPIGIYICFGEDQTLRYQVQPMPAAPAPKSK